MQNFNTRNIAETFYNSVFRHGHKGLGADSRMMFVHATATYREFKSTEPIFHTYSLDQSSSGLLMDIFRHIHFDAPWQDLNQDIELLAGLLAEEFNLRGIGQSEYVIHILKSIFFRNKGAYIVGRIYSKFNIVPFVIPILHEEDGIFADALLMDDIDVSSIFSYNRSYFLADVDIVSETVDFLRSILPSKSLGELYNSIGFEKHGKTVFYRDFLRHLAKSDENFINAPGIKGMVMSVFTLPTYNMVFKI
ncbi:MAG: bifunctional isocitrate dehydrogenase kinase/phosphatase, partial [Saprospiraceae bacterium]|nr:bifunctional isocitrate dehydrogenase kinase/phosphatase [Saprospiraceae bacterium]